MSRGGEAARSNGRVSKRERVIRTRRPIATRQTTASPKTAVLFTCLTASAGYIELIVIWRKGEGEGEEGESRLREFSRNTCRERLGTRWLTPLTTNYLSNLKLQDNTDITFHYTVTLFA